METLLAVLNLVTLAAVVIVGLLYKHYLPSYLSEKGKNLATKEDFQQVLEQVRNTTEVTKAIESKFSKGQLIGQSELEYRKEQLAEFYGPIYARIKLANELYQLWMDKKLEEVSPGIMALFRNNNSEIAKIVTNKAHLIDGDSIPKFFTHFMTSTTVWNLYTARPDRPFIEEHVAALEQVKWPKDFEDYIYAKTEELKKRLDKLHKEYEIS